MRNLSLFTHLLVTVAIVALTLLGTVSAQADGPVPTIVIGDGTFVTVKGSVKGDVLSLYRIEGDRIILVDTVINTGDRSSSDSSFQKRYLIHLDVENR